MDRIAVLLLVFSVTAGAGAEDGTKKLLDKVQGAWQVTKAQRNGKDLPADAAAKMTVVIKDATIAIGDGGVREEKATIVKADPDKTPATIELKPLRGGSESYPGILLLEGDTLKLCWSKKGDRPTEFATKDGSDHMLLVLKRAPK